MTRYALLVLMVSWGCAPGARARGATSFAVSRLASPVQQSNDMDLALTEALASALVTARHKVSAPAAAQVVLRDDRRWAAATGWAERGRAATVEDIFRIGSITKVYVAAVLVSLHVEGRLDLDDPVSRWVPDAPDADRYTIRQLLAHQTGLDDFVRTSRFAMHLSRRESMRDLLGYVERRSLRFEPGAACEYSNTNYLVAGLVIEAVTGRAWGEEVRERLLAPLQLEHTWIPSIDGEPEGVIGGYVAGVDVSRVFEPSRATAGGEIVATADDVARFAQALFFGDLVAPEVLQLMTTEMVTLDGARTGRGLGVKLMDTDHGRLMGHAGSTVSFQSRLNVHPASRTIVVSLANSFFSEADRLDEAAWSALARGGALLPDPGDGRIAVGTR